MQIVVLGIDLGKNSCSVAGLNRSNDAGCGRRALLWDWLH